MQDPNKADLIGRMFDKKKRGKKYSLKNPYLSEICRLLLGALALFTVYSEQVTGGLIAFSCNLE